MSTWEPIDDRPRRSPPRPIPALRPPPCTRPPRTTRPPPSQLPVKPRQQELKPSQRKPKRGKETFIEPPMKQEPTPTSNPKQIKRMKKKKGPHTTQRTETTMRTQRIL